MNVHYDDGPAINASVWMLVGLSTIFLALRVFCKHSHHRGLWWDDHILIAAWMTLLVQGCFTSYLVHLGVGRPQSDFNTANLDDFQLISSLAGSFAILGALWSKTSFAITVLRLSQGLQRRFVWLVIVSLNIFLVLGVVFIWAQCVPIQKIWRPSIQGKCWSAHAVVGYNVFAAGYSGTMDIVLVFIPWSIIWTLTLNKKEKAGVLMAMSSGVFAGIISFTKIPALTAIIGNGSTSSAVQLALLSAAETAVSIMACSIPILRALLRQSKHLDMPIPDDINTRHFISPESLGSLHIKSFPSVFPRRRNSFESHQLGKVVYSTYESTGTHDHGLGK